MIWAGKAALRGAMSCAIIAIIGGISGPVSAATSLPQSWNGYKWSRVGSLAISVGTNVSASWMPFVNAATAAWSADQYIDYVVKAGTAASASTCGASYGSVQICNADYGATGWVGYTQVWTVNNYIVQATIKLNEYYFSQTRYNTSAYRSLVACQELGNALGLEDADRSFTNANLGSCTDYTNDPSGTKGTNGTLANLTPSKSDFANLDQIYAKVDATQIAATKPTGTSGNAFMASVPEPRLWGMMLAGFGLLGSVIRRQRRREALARA